MLNATMEEMAEVHKYYARIIPIVANIMGVGFWIYFFNIFMTYRKVKKERGQ